MKNKSLRFAIFFCVTIIAAITLFNACSKSGGYGNSGNGGTGTGSSVSIKNFAFSVASLSVKAGTKITWTNNDAVAHTVTADDASFDSGNIAPGSTYSRTFPSTGTFTYHCSIHTSMKAKVVVQ